jgi:hypothetical protein
MEDENNDEILFDSTFESLPKSTSNIVLDQKSWYAHAEGLELENSCLYFRLLE